MLYIVTKGMEHFYTNCFLLKEDELKNFSKKMLLLSLFLLSTAAFGQNVSVLYSKYTTGYNPSPYTVDHILSGEIEVKKLATDMSLTIHYEDTDSNWISEVLDSTAYVRDSKPGYEVWAFEIRTGVWMTNESPSYRFVLKLSANGQDYWNNNNGSNFGATNPVNSLNSLYLKGSFDNGNGWNSGIAMSKDFDHSKVWKIEGVQFGDTTNERFKFDVNNDWSTSYGDYQGDGFAEQDVNATDISVPSNSVCDITFNELTLAYTIDCEQELYHADVYIHAKPTNTAYVPEFDGLTVKLMKDGVEVQSKDMSFETTAIGSIRFEDLQVGEYEVIVDDKKNNKVFKGKADLSVTAGLSNWTNINVYDCGAEMMWIRPAQSHSRTFSFTCGYDGIWSTGIINIGSGGFTSNVNLRIDNNEYGDDDPQDNVLDTFTYNPHNYIVIPQDIDIEMRINAHTKEYEIIQQNTWKKTIVFIYGETQVGQDMFVRGGIDHEYAQSQGIDCTEENKKCAIPIRHLNLRNETTAPWKVGDNYLDWYGSEDGQSDDALGTPLDWTTDFWPSSWGNDVPGYDEVGYGVHTLNTYGPHYWIMDVDMDCSKTVNGWFELKSYISNGPEWESNVSQPGTPYVSGNHFAECGKINVFKRGVSNPVEIKEFSN